MLITINDINKYAQQRISNNNTWNCVTSRRSNECLNIFENQLIRCFSLVVIVNILSIKRKSISHNIYTYICVYIKV